MFVKHFLQVKVQHGLTLRQALKKPMSMRNLSTSKCVVYVTQKNDRKCFVDWSTDTSVLAGQEVKYIHIIVHVLYTKKCFLCRC